MRGKIIGICRPNGEQIPLFSAVSARVADLSITKPLLSFL
jgi:hypothetical protein